MGDKSVYLGLDVGERRIGVAVADSVLRIAQPLTTVMVDGGELDALRAIAHQHNVTDVVLGRPRNQSGQPTAQTKAVQAFAARFAAHINVPQQWQDESLTSVMAEDRLKKRARPYRKADIDAEAATIILQDYVERLA